MNQEEQGKKMQQVIAKAWMDEGFKMRLLSDPAAVLKEEGLEMPSGMEVRMVENTDKVLHLVLPAKPNGDEMSEEQLEHVAGGFCRTNYSEDYKCNS
jgi:hypothetical protein